MQRLGTWIVGRMAHKCCKQVIFPQYSLGRDTVALLPHLNQLHNSTSGTLCGVSVNHTPYTMSYTYLALCPRESIAQRDELFMFMWKKNVQCLTVLKFPGSSSLCRGFYTLSLLLFNIWQQFYLHFRLFVSWGKRGSCGGGGGSADWTKDFVHSRQALLHWTIATAWNDHFSMRIIRK